MANHSIVTFDTKRTFVYLGYTMMSDKYKITTDLLIPRRQMQELSFEMYVIGTSHRANNK